MRNLISYMRALRANYVALRCEYASCGVTFRYPRIATLLDLCDLRNGNPFILTDLAVYHMQTRDR